MATTDSVAASAAAISPGRCAQAECIARRNELELLKRDLDEIESENEQLHEQLTRKDTESSALVLRLQQLMQDNDANTQRHADQVTLKDAEIARLHRAVDELNAALQAAQATQPHDRRADSEAAVSSHEIETIRAENESLAATVKELRAAIARETAASAHAKHAVAQFQSDSKTKRDELYNALKENELLRRERQEREDALEQVSQLALDYEIALKVLHDQQKDYLEALDELRIDNAQQRTRNEQLEQEKQSVEAKLIEMDEHESHVDVVVQQLTMQHDMEKAVLQAELLELRAKAAELAQQPHARRTHEVASAPVTHVVSLDELERQLELVHELRVRDQQRLDQKDVEIQQLRSDLASLAEHMQGKSGDMMEQATPHAVDAEARKHESVMKESLALKRRLKEQHALVEQLELRQAQLEKQLVDAQDWNAKYEANAGLEDVMAFQKKLRKELEKQQLANQKLRQELNDQRDATGKIHIAFERLKRDAGKPPEFEYDDLVIDNYFKGELAVQQSVMVQMEHQLHELENERVRLLQKLRDQARVVGGKLYEVHGLTMEQWQQVEEFMERIKLTPELAKRVRVSMEAASDSDGAAQASAQDAEVRRLQNENQRLGVELDVATRRPIVGESPNGHEPPHAARLKDAGTATQQSTRHAATSPLKPQEELIEPPTNEDGQHEHAALIQREEALDSQRKTLRSARDEEVDGCDVDRQKKEAEGGQRGRQSTEQVSPEVLAQAIAAALESRFAMLHTSMNSSATHSVATQPSPAKAATATGMDNSLLALETDGELAQHVDFLRAFQLLLDDYVQLEAQNASLCDQLAVHETACKALMDQQSVVYQHFFHLQDASTTEKAKLLYDMQQLQAQHHALQLKCQRYEATLHTVQGAVTHVGTSHGEHDAALRLRSEIVELTRRVAHDEAALATLQREHALLQDEHRLVVDDAQHLEHDWLEMERVLKFRVLYLESWKTGAEAMLARMEATLDKCVLQSVAQRHQNDLEALLVKHATLHEAYVDLHSRYLRLCPLPHQLSKIQYEHAVLVAERAARQGDDAFVSVDALAQSRITQLQRELDAQLARVNELEATSHTSVAIAVPHQPLHPPCAEDGSNERIAALEQENAVLCERISEVEQLYERLERDHAKATQAAELAATQAHVLSRKMTQERATIADKEHQLRDLMAASDDHAIVARLQQQLVHMKANYQHFLLKYDQAVAAQQHATMLHQQLQLQVETHAKMECDAREATRTQLLVLETAVGECKTRDYVLRNTKWETFKKRLDGLEEDMRAEQERRRALEKELEEKQAELPFAGTSGHTPPVVAEIHRLKSRIDMLETRERVLMGQLDAAAKSAHATRAPPPNAAASSHTAQEIVELKRVHGEMLRHVQALQARNAELLQLTKELETQKRAVAREKDSLEMEYEHVYAQWQAHHHPHHHGQQQHATNQDHASSPGSSPIMRQKVGLYEKDHVEQQQAAQASIASLKQLLTEKNAIIREYQCKITAMRADIAAAKAHERADATTLHKKLYEDNQRMIAQLKDATAKIHHLETTGSGKKALQAAQDRHEYVLQEWKRVEMELSAATATLREQAMQITALRNERDLAEARAGEALEEIVLNHEQLAQLETSKTTAEQQLQFARREMHEREQKMQALREAIIKLKEEFLKAEDRHAIDVAKAQHVLRHSKQTKSDSHERERAQWQDDKQQLEAQVQMLQEKLTLARKAEDKAKNEVAKALKTQQQHAAATGDGDADDSERTAGVGVLQAEVERLKRQLKERVVGEARIVNELEAKLKVLEAQNLALRESSVATTSTSRSDTTEPQRPLQKREQWESEKRLQRRVDVLTMRVKDKQLALAKSEQDNELVRQRLSDAEAKLQELQHAASSARDAIQGGSAPATSAREDGRMNEVADALQRQNAFLHDTLVLKRKEWEDALHVQMEQYETQLRRLRSRLAQRSPGQGSSGDAKQGLSLLEHEERAFVATHELRDELLALGDQLRDKERLAVAKDTRVLELELEVESLRAEYQRLARQSTAAVPSRSLPTTEKRSRARNRSTPSSQERLELEEVIENMKKVIEKLRSENDKLRKATATVLAPDKVEALRRQLKETRDARHELQLLADQLRADNAELKKDKLRLQQRVRVLTSATAASPAQQPNRANEEKGQRLETELEEKTAWIAELQQRLAQQDVVVQELTEQRTLVDEQRQRQLEFLAAENDQLREELSAFDHAFFDEIEELKFNYAQALRDKQRLEQQQQRVG